MRKTQYELFLDLVRNTFTGFSFNYSGQLLDGPPSIFSPYDLIREIKVPVTPIEKYYSILPEEFRSNAHAEMYRRNRGWIDRGLREGRIIRFFRDETLNIVPILSERPTVGIDSSRNLFVICCFDNCDAGIRYVDSFLNIPRSYKNNEFKWHELNNVNKTYVMTMLENILNISCKAVISINSNCINTSYPLTRNQLIRLIDGCFTGYETHPVQDSTFRCSLREGVFSFCNGTHVHCDPDFGDIKPNDVVRLVVRTLSRKEGRAQECTPSYATLKSHESLPIQLADLIAGALSSQISLRQIPPSPMKHLFFDDRKLSKKDRRNGITVKGYYWLREG